MNYHDTAITKITARGFIALMATIIISLVLLVMVVEEGTTGWYARFTILGTEAKEQASALAEGCADQALAALVTDPAYVGDSTSTTAGGDCHVFPIQFNTPAAGLVTIATQAEVRGSFANLSAVMNMASVHVGATPSAPTRGTVIVYTHMINDNGGAKMASDFTENVSASVPSRFLFAGAEGGVAVTMNPGSYSISQTAVTGYSTSASAGCSGAIAAGEVKACVLTNDDVLTTLTVIANVINNNGGTVQVGDIVLHIDGVSKTSGQPNIVTPGVHTVTGTDFVGYTPSSWGYNCSSSGTITINSGDNKTCIITYDDNPPAAPVCADTVMMLDRSGSMFTDPAWISDEKIAATTLVDLYSGVTPVPKVGFGRFGDVASGVSAEIVSQLSTAYAAIKTAISGGLPQNPISYTNLADAITQANNELNGVRHDPTKQKVLIMVSDGEPNRPTGTLTIPTTLVASTTGTYDAWSAVGGTKVDAIASADGDTTYLTTPLPSHTFSFAGAGIPPSASVFTVTLHAIAKEVGGTTGNIMLMAENGSAQSSDAGHPLTTSYADYAWAMSASPLSGSAWTVSEVNSWSTKFGVINASTGSTVPRVTQLYAVVNFNTSSDSGLKSPGAAHTPNSWSNPTRAFASDNLYATDSTNNHQQGFSNFGLSIPTGSMVTGVAVTVEAKSSDASGCYMGAELSTNGSSFTNSSNDAAITSTSDSVYVLGDAADLWGRSWTPTDFNSNNFTVRLTNLHRGGCSNSATLSVDQVQVRVYYTVAGSVTVLPISTGNLSGWTANAGSATSSVATNDSDATYLSTTVASGQVQSFLFSNMNVPSGATNLSVTLHAFAEEFGGSNGSIQLIAERGGTPSVDSTHALTGSYVDYSRTMNTNPVTGNAWTVAEVNNWSTKFGVLNTSTGGSAARVTQLYLVVAYDIATDPTAAVYAAADAAKLSGTNIFTIHFGDTAGRDLLARLASGVSANAPHQSGSFYDPGGIVNGTLVAAASATTSPNQFTTPQNAFASDNVYTTDTASGHQQGYKNFVFSVPPGATIGGVEVDTEAKSTDSNGCQVGVEVSYDGGMTWSSTGNKFTITSANDATYILGGSATTWGHAWVAADLASGKFAVRMQDIDPGSACTNGSKLSIDQVLAKVYYTVITENGDGDNFFIAPSSADMKSIFEFIGSQVCPATVAPAPTPPPTTAMLLVTTTVVNDNGTGSKTPSDFTTNVSAVNPSQTSFAGNTAGVAVTVDPGNYSVTEVGVSGYTQKPSATCSSALSGAIVAGETRVCTLANDDIPPPPAPPNTTITTGSFGEVPTSP